jgi:hypothetical protein
MMTPRLKQELYILLNALSEGTITNDEFDRLDIWLKSNKEACRIYVDFTSVWSDLQYFHASSYSQSERSVISIQDMVDKPDYFTDSAIWKALADAEKGAPAVEIDVPQEPKILIQKVQREKIVRKISKSTLITLCTAAAAIILILVFAHFAPTETGFKVAVLSDSINAKWGDKDSGMEKGTAIFTSRAKIVLREGYAKLLFDNQTQVTLQGPAEFGILAEDKIDLRYGRLYAIVSPEAIGFMITTQNAKVIDLGTEFGVEIDTLGDTCLHVMKGKTTLITGEISNKLSTEVVGGVAKKVSADSQAVSDISCDEGLFVRDIDSADGMIRRDETSPSNNYINWTAESGNWSEDANWDAVIKPDETRTIRLRKSNSTVCTLNTAQKLMRARLVVSNGQIFNIENGGSLDCGWARFGWSTVNMTGNGTLRLNNENLIMGCPIYGAGACVWTMSDTSKVDISQDADNEQILAISQDNAAGTLKLVGSGVTVNCKHLYVGYARYPGFAPHATLEYVMDAGGVSTIHVGYRTHLSEGAATAHLVLKAAGSLPAKDLVLIETKGKAKIKGDGAFDTLNGGPAAEGTPITLGGNQYTLTYQYEANGDGYRNDIALVLKKDL